MKIKICKKVESKNGLLVIPIFKNELEKFSTIYPETVKEFLKNLTNNKDFKAKKGEFLAGYLAKKDLPNKILVVGFGKKEKYTRNRARNMGGKIGKYLKSIKEKELSMFITANLEEHMQEFAEGLMMCQYEIDKLKTKKCEECNIKLFNAIVGKNESEIKGKLEKGDLISHGVEYVKDLVNTPSNIENSEYMAAEAEKIAKENGYKVKIVGEKEMGKMGWGALLAVNKGSEKDAKCICLEYEGSKMPTEKPIILIGKGIIFDTGGYHLKPINHIETMHQDMAGGAIVLGIFKILKKLKIRKNIIGIIPVAENLIGPKSYRPSDIIKSLSGLTIEVTNTDAEGRLILADAITYATRFKPKSIITIATLTGAIAVALGDRYAGIMGNDLKLRKNLIRAGQMTDDLLWPIPIHADYRKKIESEIADIRNYDRGTGHFGAAAKAAAFLEKFIEKNSWAHIDIGGTAYTENPKEYQTKGATAHSFQAILKFLEIN